MSADPRAALDQLFAAFERHLEACAGRGGEDDPTVVAAYDDLADAFEAYDAALYDAYEEMTPLDIYAGADQDAEDDVDDDEDDEDDDIDDDDGEVEDTDEALEDHDEDGDDAQLYSGLDDEEFDYEDAPRA